MAKPSPKGVQGAKPALAWGLGREPQKTREASMFARSANMEAPRTSRLSESNRRPAHYE